MHIETKYKDGKLINVYQIMTIRPRNPSLQNVKFIMVNKEMKLSSNGAHNFYAIRV